MTGTNINEPSLKKRLRSECLSNKEDTEARHKETKTQNAPHDVIVRSDTGTKPAPTPHTKKKAFPTAETKDTSLPPVLQHEVPTCHIGVSPEAPSCPVAPVAVLNIRKKRKRRDRGSHLVIDEERQKEEAEEDTTTVLQKTAMPENLIKECHLALSKIMNHEMSRAFREPMQLRNTVIDPDNKLGQTYREVIKNPMDLGSTLPLVAANTTCPKSNPNLNPCL